MTDRRLFVGLMSGTSADSIDAALVAFAEDHCQLMATHTHNLAPELKAEIHALSFPGHNEIARLGVLDHQLGHCFAAAVTELLTQAAVPAYAVTAIGSHGQTIRHEPAHGGGTRFTLQIADANIIAEQTGILTIADFRRRDIACGGQGAPLTPAFHKAQFSSANEHRCIVNIGGIANITVLPAQGDVIGFDTGPGNTLLDAWIQQCSGLAFDRDGTWAASGTLISKLLHAMLQHPFLPRPAPKSTGREDFNINWLMNLLASFPRTNAADVQATLLEFTAVTIANAIHAQCEPGCAVFVCGGGAHNAALMQRLQAHLAHSTIYTTEALDLDPDWVEAAAFAWLAKQYVDGKPGNLPAVTGAGKLTILGAAYPATSPVLNREG